MDIEAKLREFIEQIHKNETNIIIDRIEEVYDDSGILTNLKVIGHKFQAVKEIEVKIKFNVS